MSARRHDSDLYRGRSHHSLRDLVTDRMPPGPKREMQLRGDIRVAYAPTRRGRTHGDAHDARSVSPARVQVQARDSPTVRAMLTAARPGTAAKSPAAGSPATASPASTGSEALAASAALRSLEARLAHAADAAASAQRDRDGALDLLSRLSDAAGGMHVVVSAYAEGGREGDGGDAAVPSELLRELEGAVYAAHAHLHGEGAAPPAVDAAYLDAATRVRARPTATMATMSHAGAHSRKPAPAPHSLTPDAALVAELEQARADALRLREELALKTADAEATVAHYKATVGRLAEEGAVEANAWRDRLREAHDEIDRLRRDMRDASEASTEASARRDAAAAAQAEAARLRDTTDTLRGTVAKLEEQLAIARVTARRDAARHDEDQRALGSQVEAHRRERDVLAAERDALADSVARLESDVLRARAVASASSTATSPTSSSGALKAEIEKLTGMLETLGGDRDRLAASEAQAQREVARLKARVAELEAASDSAASENELLSAAAQSAQTQVQAAREQADAAERRAVAAEARASEAERSLAEAQRRAAAAGDEAAAATAAAAAAEKRGSEAEAAADARVAEAEAAKEAAATAAAAAEAAHAAVVGRIKPIGPTGYDGGGGDASAPSHKHMRTRRGTHAVPDSAFSAAGVFEAPGKPVVTSSSAVVRRFEMQRQVEMLRTSSLFAGVDSEDLERFASQCVALEYSDGEFVIRQLMPGEAMFFVLQGTLSVLSSTISPDGDLVHKELLRRGRGTIVGEFALISDAPRRSSVRAVGTVKVLKLTRSGYSELYGGLPEGSQLRRCLDDILQND